MRFRPSMLAATIAVTAMTVPVLAFDTQVGATRRPEAARQLPPLAAAASPTWTACFEDVTAETGIIYECAEVTAPLDYDRPWVGTLQIAMTRVPASDPATRRGSILLNPGGPGVPGVDFIVDFGPFIGLELGEAIPQQFDMIGFDPRGIGRSAPIRCFPTLDEAFGVIPTTPFPLTPTEIRSVKRLDHEFARACRGDGDARAIGRHMSTANVARDMDVIRQAIGDEYLNYFAGSYGTFLGATYANLFPDRVGAMVIDGVLDPVAWVNEEGDVPFTTRLRSDEGAAQTLDEFFAQCEAAEPGNCAFAPDAKARFDELAQEVRRAPVTIVDPVGGESFTVGYQDLIGLTLNYLYNPFAYAELSQVLAFLESAAFGTPLGAVPVNALTGRLFHVRRDPYPNFIEARPAVACVDSNNPRSYRAWARAGAAADAEFGYFGRIWTWELSACAVWPFRDRDRYQGPFTAETANPVLIIGNLYDPATRYAGARTLRSLMPNSALLTVDAPGHTSLGLSICAGATIGAFLLDPSIAPDIDGTTCPQEFNVFDIVGGPPPLPATAPEATTDGAAPDLRTTEIAPAPDDLAAMIELRTLLDRTRGLVPPAIAD